MEQSVDNKNFSVSATLGLSLAIFVIYSVLQSIILFAHIFVSNTFENVDSFVKFISNEDNMLNGNSFGFTAIVSGILGWLIVIGFTKTKKNIDLKNYLGFHKVDWKKAWIWPILLLLYMVLEEQLMTHFPTLFESDFAEKLISTTDNLWVLLLGVGIVAPIFEELLFRGFMYKGLANKYGGISAAIITSLIFAAIHIQYNPLIIILLIPVGLILGLSRYYTKSIWVPIILHCINNSSGIIYTMIMG